MMTGMTCTLTDKSKMEFHDKTNTKTVEKSMNNSSPLGALSKSIVGNSPITRTMYGIPFIRENDSGLHVHALISESGMNTTKYGNGREKLESIVLSMKKKSELDNASPRGKRSQMSRHDAELHTQGSLYAEKADVRFSQNYENKGDTRNKI